MKIKNAIAAGVALIAAMGSAQAALHDRGGGLIYDDVLKVTWLQDANYAKTSGYDADGRMNWSDANAWATNLVYGGYDDWRLARNSPVNGESWIYSPQDGTPEYVGGKGDRGYNIVSTASELSYMYYVNLGLKGKGDYFYDERLRFRTFLRTDFGVMQSGIEDFSPESINLFADVGLVKNLYNFMYWSGTVYEEPVGEGMPEWDHFAFITTIGRQWMGFDNQRLYAWAVRDGDVTSPVPEPETYAMMLAGLGLLGVVARRRKQKLNA